MHFPDILISPNLMRQIESLIVKATDPLWAIAANIEALTLTTAAAKPSNGVPCLYRVERVCSGKYNIRGPGSPPALYPVATPSDFNDDTP